MNQAVSLSAVIARMACVPGIALAQSVFYEGKTIQIISGYKGTADMRLAAESGEIDGTTWGWDSMRGTW